MPTRRSVLRATGTAAGGLALAGRAAATADPNDPVLLVHGYGDSEDSPWWDRLVGYFEAAGYDREKLYVIELGELWATTVDSPREYADQVKARLEAIRDEHGGPVDVVAHSMGGLDSRWAVEKEGAADLVDDLVTLGTPHQGTYAAYLGYATEGGRDMVPGSDFLTELNDGRLAPNVEYSALWSSTDELVVPQRFGKLPSPELDTAAEGRNVNTGRQEHVQLVWDRDVFEQYVGYLD